MFLNIGQHSTTIPASYTLGAIYQTFPQGSKTMIVLTFYVDLISSENINITQMYSEAKRLSKIKIRLIKKLNLKMNVHWGMLAIRMVTTSPMSIECQTTNLCLSRFKCI